MFQIDRKQQIVVMILGAVLLFTAGYKISRWQGDSYQGPAVNEGIVQSGQGEGVREIVVHVAGAVENPGVYKFDREARVADALERAKPLSQGDVQGLNLAAPLKDGQKIVVPLKLDAADGIPGPQGAATVGGKTFSASSAERPLERININRAGPKELEALPGIGPALAQRIVDHRENSGYFGSEEEIKNVPGIGEKLFNRIREKISVD